MKQLSYDEENKFPVAAPVLRSNFYMYDAETLEEAKGGTYLRGKEWTKGDPGSEFAARREVFLADVRGKKLREMACVRFKADRTTSKRIRYGFITVKSTTLIGLNSPRKNTTLPAIRSVEPRRTHIPV
ncbi:hypothetical protein TNCV_3921951 [Trichonephila clavipes]|nr:hypothetical protein TNCV_3921951 [Trichonephila clavipes]